MRYILTLVTILIALPVTASAYTVQSGDTWQSIADKNGMTLSQLMALNAPAAGQNVVTAAPSQTPTTNSARKCINIGYEPLTNGQHDLTKWAGQLGYLKSHGYDCVRLGFYGPNSSIPKPLAVLAKSSGFYVAVGADGDPNSSNYGAGIAEQAKWAQANGIDEFTIGNEAAKNNTTQQALAKHTCTAKQYFKGIVSYSTYENDPGQWSDIAAWKANRGCLDKFNINTYGGYQFNKWVIDRCLSLIGSCQVSETNADIMNVPAVQSDSGLANYLKGDFLRLRSEYPNMKLFFFSWDAGGNGVSTRWSIQNYPVSKAVLGL